MIRGKRKRRTTQAFLSLEVFSKFERVISNFNKPNFQRARGLAAACETRIPNVAGSSLVEVLFFTVNIILHKINVH